MDSLPCRGVPQENRRGPAPEQETATVRKQQGKSLLSKMGMKRAPADLPTLRFSFCRIQCIISIPFASWALFIITPIIQYTTVYLSTFVRFCPLSSTFVSFFVYLEVKIHSIITTYTISQYNSLVKVRFSPKQSYCVLFSPILSHLAVNLY